MKLLRLQILSVLLFVSACSVAGSPEETLQTSAVTPPNRQSTSTVSQIEESNASPPVQRAEPESSKDSNVEEASPTPLATDPYPTSCSTEICNIPSLFLKRPIVRRGNQITDATYRFGTTQGGRRETHYGVEFLNGFGTPVLAAADGVVLVAGDDLEPTSEHGEWPITFYGPYSNFYGNLVVIEHLAPDEFWDVFSIEPQPIYTLYAHLSEIRVKEGARVQEGQVIGEVGLSGIATGSHLHFEVRIGANEYQNVSNPELWLAPLKNTEDEPFGGMAGAFVDKNGNTLALPSVVLKHLPDGPQGAGGAEFYTMSYEDKSLVGQIPFEESFAVGDLPAGWYKVTYPYNGLKEGLVEVKPEMLTLLTIRVD